MGLGSCIHISLWDGFLEVDVLFGHQDDWLVVEPTHLKNMLVKLDHETPGKDENKQYLKPPSKWPHKKTQMLR